MFIHEELNASALKIFCAVFLLMDNSPIFALLF